MRRFPARGGRADEFRRDRLEETLHRDGCGIHTDGGFSRHRAARTRAGARRYARRRSLGFRRGRGPLPRVGRYERPRSSLGHRVCARRQHARHRAPGPPARRSATASLDPAPIGPLPAMLATGLGGMLDVALHPKFAQNRLIYFAYSKPRRRRRATPRRRCIARGGTAARRSPTARTSSSRRLLGRAGHRSDARSRDAAATARGSRSTARACSTSRSAIATTAPSRRIPRRTSARSCASTDDGSVPPDNPFVGQRRLQAGDLDARPSQSARPGVQPTPTASSGPRKKDRKAATS